MPEIEEKTINSSGLPPRYQKTNESLPSAARGDNSAGLCATD